MALDQIPMVRFGRGSACGRLGQGCRGPDGSYLARLVEATIFSANGSWVGSWVDEGELFARP
jgi:hypothetical protein